MLVRASRTRSRIIGDAASGRAATRSRNEPSTSGASTWSTVKRGSVATSRAVARGAMLPTMLASTAGPPATTVASREAALRVNGRRISPTRSPLLLTWARAKYAPGGSIRISLTPCARTEPVRLFTRFPDAFTTAGPSAVAATSKSTVVASSSARSPSRSIWMASRSSCVTVSSATRVSPRPAGGTRSSSGSVEAMPPMTARWASMR